MAIYDNYGNEITKVYVGTQEIDSIYAGTQQVFSNHIELPIIQSANVDYTSQPAAIPTSFTLTVVLDYLPPSGTCHLEFYYGGKINLYPITATTMVITMSTSGVNNHSMQLVAVTTRSNQRGDIWSAPAYIILPANGVYGVQMINAMSAQLIGNTMQYSEYWMINARNNVRYVIDAGGINNPWLSYDIASAKAALELLATDQVYFESHIWSPSTAPHSITMTGKSTAHYHLNVADYVCRPDDNTAIAFLVNQNGEISGRLTTKCPIPFEDGFRYAFAHPGGDIIFATAGAYLNVSDDSFKHNTSLRDLVYNVFTIFGFNGYFTARMIMKYNLLAKPRATDITPKPTIDWPYSTVGAPSTIIGYVRWATSGSASSSIALEIGTDSYPLPSAPYTSALRSVNTYNIKNATITKFSYMGAAQYAYFSGYASAMYCQFRGNDWFDLPTPRTYESGKRFVCANTDLSVDELFIRAPNNMNGTYWFDTLHLNQSIWLDTNDQNGESLPAQSLSNVTIIGHDITFNFYLDDAGVIKYP